MCAFVIELVYRITLVNGLVDGLFDVVKVGLQFPNLGFHFVQLDRMRECHSYSIGKMDWSVGGHYLVHFFHELLLEVNYFGVMVNLFLLDMKLLKSVVGEVI